ncbi:MAG: hypothetical protein ACTS1Z_01410, partial [Parasphingopyxis sp.]
MKRAGFSFAMAIKATFFALLACLSVPGAAQPIDTSEGTPVSQAVVTEDQALETAPPDSQAAAQSASSNPPVYGPAIDLPLIDNIDENGVDLSTGYFRISGPSLSAGTEDHSIPFSMQWAGQNWITNLPAIWFDNTDNLYTVHHGGVTTEFEDSSRNYAEVTPVRGNTLNCEVGPGTDYCSFLSRNGDAVTFIFTTPGPIPSIDYAYAPYGNLRAVLANLSDQSLIRIGNSVGYFGDVSYSTDSDPFSVGSYTVSWGAANARDVTVVLNARTAQGNETVQSLTINTPNHDISDDADHFLFPSGTTQTITGPEGRVWQFDINNNSEITEIRRPDNTVVRITDYTPQHRVETLFDPDNRRWQYSYSNDGTYRTITRTNPLLGVMVVRAHMEKGYIVEVTDELGRTTFYDHDSTTHYLTRIRYPEGNSLEFDYDSRGNITARRAIPSPRSGATITETAVYLSSCSGGSQGTYPRNCNQPQRYFDGNMNSSGSSSNYEYRYEDSGTSAPTRIQRPLVPYPGFSNERNWTTDNSFVTVSGQRVLSVSQTCRVSSNCDTIPDRQILTEIGYETNTDLVLPETVTTRAGDNSVSTAVTNSYDLQGNLIAVDGPLPGPADTTRYAYNDNRELIATVGPDPDGSGPLKPPATRNVYDNMGRVILEDTGTVNTPTDTSLSTFASLNRTATQYDAMGRAVIVASATSAGTYSVIHTSYDLLSRPICSAVRMNAATFPSVSSNGIISGGALPASACTLGAPGAQGNDRITYTNYDAAGQVTSILRAYGTSDQITYAAYTYDANGNRLSV